MLEIGDTVKAARRFRDPYCRFRGAKKIIGYDTYFDSAGSVGYILDGKSGAMYHRRDLVSENVEMSRCRELAVSSDCESCRKRFRCWTR